MPEPGESMMPPEAVVNDSPVAIPTVPESASACRDRATNEPEFMSTLPPADATSPPCPWPSPTEKITSPPFPDELPPAITMSPEEVVDTPEAMITLPAEPFSLFPLFKTTDPESVTASADPTTTVPLPESAPAPLEMVKSPPMSAVVVIPRRLTAPASTSLLPPNNSTPLPNLTSISPADNCTSPTEPVDNLISPPVVPTPAVINKSPPLAPAITLSPPLNDTEPPLDASLEPTDSTKPPAALLSPLRISMSPLREPASGVSIDTDPDLPSTPTELAADNSPPIKEACPTTPLWKLRSPKPVEDNVTSPPVVDSPTATTIAPDAPAED